MRVPKGPNGEKRPADVIGNAVRIMQIATGEVEEGETASPARVAASAKGGAARAANLDKSDRQAIAKKAAASRWKKD